MKLSKNTISYIIFLSVFFIVFGLYLNFYTTPEKDVKDFKDIIKTQQLNVVISTNFIDYFIYNAEPMGFYFEILNRFACDYELKLVLYKESDHKIAFEMLNDETCDIFAATSAFPKNICSGFSLSTPLRTTRKVLVQQKSNTSQKQTKLDFIKNYLDLLNKTAGILNFDVDFFALEEHFRNLSDSITVETAIKNIANKTLDYVICDYNLARIFDSYYKNIDIETNIGFEQDVCWITRKKSTELLETLNAWLIKFKETPEFFRLEQKYTANSRALLNINSEYYSGNKGRISEYDELLKKYSKLINWDWRLLSSLVYEESRFDPEAESYAGAFGLMQMMPATYESVSNDTTWQIEFQIEAGIRYIRIIDSFLPAEFDDTVSKIKLILAGYNIGFSHVEDAINLAIAHGKNPKSWDDVSYFLLNLSKPEYYNNPVVKYGSFSGNRAVRYANSIYDRFLHYRNLIPK
ncbi:transglycosylase SLT domain-containing protein [Bacteroidales bacterium OttesenSCG-928-I21]|nr:transglycosylase SLT domain-containing protein [Bacteroidales bacterium OttesenSCG-928-I21]